MIWLLLACDPDPDLTEPTVVELLAGESRVEVSSEGHLSLWAPDGRRVLDGAVATVTLDASDGTGTEVSTLDTGGVVAESHTSDALGETHRVVLTTPGTPELIWTVSAYDEGFVTVDLQAVNRGDGDLTVVKAAAIQTESGRGAGFYLGDELSTHRILENGSWTLLDFVAEVRAANSTEESSYSDLVPGHLEGTSVSNWNHAMTDLATDATWVAGALSFDSTTPVLAVTHSEWSAPVSDDGRQGFARFAAEAAWVPQPRVLASGEALATERFYLHAGEPDAAMGLESYAEVLAAALGVTPWNRRNGGQAVPNGWNSWSGSGSSGGYGTDIDEELILDNLDVMATELRDWGMDWFQIDDGYEPYDGDWTWREDRFPNGPRWLSDQIRDRGLRPGLWIAAYSPDPDSQLVADHPEWMADKTAIGSVFVAGSEILDLTHPEVLDYIEDLGRTVRQDWGYEWLKLDFGYYALFGDGFHDPTRSREEAWHGAMEALRAGLGHDAFLLTIGAVGVNLQHGDSHRTTLDNMPVWDAIPGTTIELEEQGLKPTVRTAGRRWYYQDRVWVNHPDLIFFRSNPNDLEWPRLTLEEAQAFATFVGLSGGLVKLGDRLVDLEPSHVNSIRVLLPIHGRAARPLDVFTREFPEQWWLPAEDGDGHLLGLFHWGSNTDLSVNPEAEIEDTTEDRAHTVDLEALGLTGEWLAYEFWTGELLGTFSDVFTLDVPSHTSRAVVLRRAADHPSWLGWNRHWSMGETLLESSDWDEGARTLTVVVPIAAETEYAPFGIEIALHAPAGFEASEVSASGAGIDGPEVGQTGEVVRVSFAPRETGTLTVEVGF